MADFLSAAEAARRLGVKPATLYAYVSRGVLSRGKAADGRASLFNADEVERLARRGRPRRPAGVADIKVESAITEIAGDSLRFRGLDATRLAVSRTFEEVAELLWTGELRSAREPWQARPAALAAGRAAQAALPAGTLPLERLQVIVPAMAATDPLRLQLDPAAVLAAGRSIIAGMVDCLPSTVISGPGTSSPGQPVAERLWSRLCDRRASPALMRAHVRCAGAAGRSRAGRLDAGRPGRRLGAGGSVRRGRDRSGCDERSAARRGVARRGDADGRGQRSG